MRSLEDKASRNNQCSKKQGLTAHCARYTIVGMNVNTGVRDLVIFEERIRQNLDNVRLLRGVVWRRFLVRFLFLLLLLLVAVRLLYLRFVPSGWTHVFLLAAFLILLAVMAVWCLFGFASWRRAVAACRYEEQLQKTLVGFSMQIRHPLHRDQQGNILMRVFSQLFLSASIPSMYSGEITFLKRLPRSIALFLEAYRTEYRARRALRSNPKKNM